GLVRARSMLRETRDQVSSKTTGDLLAPRPRWGACVGNWRRLSILGMNVIAFTLSDYQRLT
ncbi:MAG: hypothetical protein ACOVN2_04210, partial [Usitatibacteraceae bacterium]